MTHRLSPAMARRNLLATTFAVLALAPVSSSFAQTPGGALLAITRSDGQVVSLDLAALDALEQHAITTSTNWTEGVLTFSGPTLSAVLESAGVPPGPVEAEAANGYKVTLTFPPGNETVPIVATRIDGAPIDRREKGPLWVIFPYDSDEAYRNPEVFGQSIWHLERLTAMTAE